MMIRSKAPLRISFCGGGTDLKPYLDEKGGCVLSATINRFAYSGLEIGKNKEISINSMDYDLNLRFGVDQKLIYDGELDLVKAVINHFKIKEGLDMFIHSDAPPGSGLGSSSSLTVALIGLFMRWRKMPLTEYDIAELAYQIERIEVGIPGGMQDQYASTFGGVNFIEFSKDKTIVNPLRINQDILNELEYSLLLCYTGGSRMSAKIIDKQVNNYIIKNKQTIDAMDSLKSLTIEMKDALLQGKLNRFGECLDEAWNYKKKMADGITHSKVDEMYSEAKKEGAIGGKLTGAGGGGYLLLFCKFDKKHKVAARMVSMGGEIVNFGLNLNGVQTWRTGN
jgi:D-glycero-alpha-D-manno-heptose-7-phosphate kinase